MGTYRHRWLPSPQCKTSVRFGDLHCIFLDTVIVCMKLVPFPHYFFGLTTLGPFRLTDNSPAICIQYQSLPVWTSSYTLTFIFSVSSPYLIFGVPRSIFLTVYSVPSQLFVIIVSSSLHVLSKAIFIFDSYTMLFSL